MKFSVRHLAGALGLAFMLAAPVAHAGLFDDDEARRAILDLRQQLEKSNEAQRVKQAELNAQMSEQLGQLRRTVLDLSNQLEAMRSEMARMRGQEEQLAREVADIQRKQKDVEQGVDERMRKLEPQKVTLDGKEFQVETEERSLYEAALAQLRTGDFAGAAVALGNFQRRYPNSGYADSVRFWLGNAQYGKRDYKQAIASFRSLVAASPDHPHAPEALLSVANCQAEMKDIKGARKTLADLIKGYPKSEAAVAGKERLASLK